MLVEICNLDNGSGVNSNLDVYLSYNDTRKLFELRPYCRIDENDFAEILTNKQIENMQNGQIHFRINKAKLEKNANKVY